jgi:hypothetical protein
MSTNTVVNNRRKAANNTTTIETKHVGRDYGNQERRKLVPLLTSHERKILEEYQTTDSRTEADIYTVFHCRPDPNYGRVSIETDTCPILIAEQIHGLDHTNESTVFCLPTHTIHNEAWLKHMPTFETWLLSMARYPSQSSYDKNIIIPGSSRNVKFISQLDRLEVYTSCFHGTLMHWFNTPHETKYLSLLWKLYRTIQFIIMSYGSTSKLSPQKVENFKILLQNRDKSLADALAFKNFCVDLHPAQYYETYYYLMKHCPEVSHRSRLTNPHSLIWGLLTQKMLDVEEGVEEKFEERSNGNPNEEKSDFSLPHSLSTYFLQIYLERGLKNSQSLPQNPQTLDKEKLVEMCHQRFGYGMIYTLRHFNFIFSVCSLLYSSSGLVSQSSFTECIENIAKQVKSLRNVTGLCKVSCPKVDFTDDFLAEVLLQYHQNIDKNVSMNFGFHHPSFVPCTPLLDETLIGIHKKLEKLKEQLEENKRQIDKRIEENKKALDCVSDNEVRLKATLANINSIKCCHKFTNDYLKGFLTNIYALCSSGSASNIYTLKYVLDHSGEFGLGRRRLQTFCFRSTPVDSPLEAYWLSLFSSHDYHQRKSMEQISQPRTCLNKLLWELTHQDRADSQSHEKKKSTMEEGAKLIDFVPFQLTRELDLQVVECLKMLKAKAECVICYETGKLVALHKDYRHAVCKECSEKLVKCPFCRKEKNKDGRWEQSRDK